MLVKLMTLVIVIYGAYQGVALENYTTATFYLVLAILLKME